MGSNGLMTDITITKEDITIRVPQKGIGESPYIGYGRIQNLELFQVPGIAKIQYRLTLKYSTLGLPIAIIKDVYGNEWVATQNNYLYLNGSRVFSTTHSGSGFIYDMKIVADYLLITRGTAGVNVIDTIGPLANGGLVEFAAWKSLTNSAYNAPILTLTGNQYVYIGNGNYVASLTSFVANANPTIAPTATYSATAIPLQTNEYCRTLGVLGRNLLIGTQGGSSFNDLTYNQSNLYPYDLSTLTLGFPIPFQENGINQIFTYNNITYVHAGIYGNIYVTNGSSAQFYRKATPFNRSFGTTMFPYPNAINYINNQLLVGTSTGADSFPTTSIHGVYTLPSKDKLNFRTISTENVGTNQALYIGAILPTGNDLLLVGWQDGTSYGVDTADFRTYQDFSAYFESPVITVADPENNATFDDLVINLGQTLISSQQIKVEWRDGYSDTWTTIKDVNGQSYFDMTSGPSGSTALFAKSLINNVNTVQLRVSLVQSLSVTAGSNIFLLGIKLKRHNTDG